ncbi:unnamed protein product [Amoebophrya sp. A120]|nr:unnamed protein product [Amoebophrya sp. A120]|eukprot:GSA120T00013447001.1
MYGYGKIPASDTLRGSLQIMIFRKNASKRSGLQHEKKTGPSDSCITDLSAFPKSHDKFRPRHICNAYIKHQNLLARVRVWYRERQKRLREARRKRQEEKLVKKALKEKNSIKPLDYWRQFRQWWKKAKEEISDENLERLANNCTAEQERFAGWATKYHLVNETAKDAEWQWCDLAKKTSQPFTQMQEKYKFDNAIGDSKSVEHLRLVNCMEDPDVYSDAKEAPVVDHFCQNVADEEQSKSFSPFGDDDDE